MTTNKIEDILLLFNRPKVPIFIPKGENKVAFEIPKSYVRAEYRENSEKIISQYEGKASRVITINEIDCTDCGSALKLGRNEQFSVFVTEHAKMAGDLIKLFMSKKDFNEFLSIAAYCSEHVNTAMFIYALSVAILHRPDCHHLRIPSLVGVFPNLFMNGTTLKQAVTKANVIQSSCEMVIDIAVDRTASDLDIEHRVAYFREDLGVSLHHHHWHLVYPDTDVGKKDRRGELFYYMHQQILARYNFERLSNHLMRVKSFNNLREPIAEGYFPKLESDVASRTFPGRQSGAVLKDVDRTDSGQFELQDLERFRDRILEAIHRGKITKPDGTLEDLDEVQGIDILGHLIEASPYSLNKTLYGNLHNRGHIAIGVCHDPDQRHLQGYGVMAENSTALRDPIFYRWHTFIDDIFQAHKNLLTPYSKDQLSFEGVKISSVQIGAENKAENLFNTHWQRSMVDISGGLDFPAPTGNSQGQLPVRFTHLNHEPFSYEITVTNDTPNEKTGTVRIFLAPMLDERGSPFLLKNLRKLWVELDKYTVTLPPGTHTLPLRESTESSITIPFEETFPDLKNTGSSLGGISRDSYCGCGWPQHMLIPKGTADGFPVLLFVMISNYEDDKVGPIEKPKCKSAVSFCGLRDQLYPDRKAMGFPFDRPVAPEKEFIVTENMHIMKTKIVFTDNGNLHGDKKHA